MGTDLSTGPFHVGDLVSVTLGADGAGFRGRITRIDEDWIVLTFEGPPPDMWIPAHSVLALSEPWDPLGARLT